MQAAISASATPPEPAAAPRGSPAPPLLGALASSPAIRFVTKEQREALVHAQPDGALVARIEAIGADARGRLGDLVDDEIERLLAANGAPPAGIARDFDAAVSDKLYRARKVGAHALIVAFGPLRGAASARGALDAADTETLRALARATKGRPLTLVLDTSDAATDAHAYPVPLASLLATKTLPPPPFDAAPASAPAPAPAPAPEPETGSVSVSDSDSDSDSDSESVPDPAPLLKHTAGASLAPPDEPWRHWSLQLLAARGPQPTIVLERLFTESYLPLANALAAGLDDARARHARDEFRDAFAKSYTDACPTFVATGKRPKMVLDAIDLAHRSARLHGARAAHVLLVDGMRYDVGAAAKKRCVELVAARATLTDDLLLWSALPTTTPRQLFTLARGVEALRAPSEDDAESDALRGRSAEVVRRLRVGSRDVYKLDVVDARVRALRGGVLDAIESIGADVAEIVSRHAASLPPRTLLFVLGDHGFSVERDGSTRHGGASPEEVLVPAFALLVGDVH